MVFANEESKPPEPTKKKKNMQELSQTLGALNFKLACEVLKVASVCNTECRATYIHCMHENHISVLPANTLSGLAYLAAQYNTMCLEQSV